MSGTVSIVGCGALTGAGRGVEAFWEALRTGEPLLERHDLGDPRLADATYVAVPEPRQPNGELAASWLWLACNDARQAAAPVLERLESPRVAMLCGSSLGGMTLFETAHRYGVEAAVGPGLPTEALPGWRALYDGPTRHVGAGVGASAGAWTLNTACSSAANAIGVARRWLLGGRIDAALVAGFDVISPFVYTGFLCLGAMDPEPTTPFGVARRGLNLGDAAVAFVLVRSADANQDAVRITGYGSSCDAHHLTRPDLEGRGLARALRAALRSAGLSPAEIDMINAHGTGTPYNDTMETAAFVDVFGDDTPPLHCAKPVFGHTLGASGAIDALAVHEMLRRGVLPATYLRGDEDPELAVHPERRERGLDPTTVALSTSSGFGGSNAVLVMRRGDG
ncbi:MAG: beta-ketoacyl synthase N-terminal-like domain-containing protein [Myxococcota bacterium]